MRADHEELLGAVMKRLGSTYCVGFACSELVPRPGRLCAKHAAEADAAVEQFVSNELDFFLDMTTRDHEE
jgi:hypothetical protein